MTEEEKKRKRGKKREKDNRKREENKRKKWRQKKLKEGKETDASNITASAFLNVT